MHHELGLHRAREDDRQHLHDHPGRSEPEGTQGACRGGASTLRHQLPHQKGDGGWWLVVVVRLCCLGRKGKTKTPMREALAGPCGKAVFADGEHVITEGVDDTAKIWEVSTGWCTKLPCSWRPCCTQVKHQHNLHQAGRRGDRAFPHVDTKETCMEISAYRSRGARSSWMSLAAGFRAQARETLPSGEDLVDLVSSASTIKACNGFVQRTITAGSKTTSKTFTQRCHFA